LASPFTIATIPEATLRAFDDHGHVGPAMPRDGGDAEEVLDQFVRAGVDVHAVAGDLQREGAETFVRAWNDLLACINTKSEALS
jgi:transaldolase